MAQDKLKAYGDRAMALDVDGKVMEKVAVVSDGEWYRLSTETKPTAADGVKDGHNLLLVDTGQVFVYYSSQWREL